MFACLENAFNTVFSRVEAIAKSGLVAIDRRYVLAPARN